MEISYSFSEFEIAKKILEKYGSITAREMAGLSSEFGVKWDKGQSNSILYKMLARNLVVKELRGGSRPYWQIGSNTDSTQSKPEKLKVLKKSPGVEDFIPLKAIEEYSIYLKDTLIEFALNTEASANDPYISCDWLEQKIFVAINPNHPYMRGGLASEQVLSDFLLFLAVDAHCEWRIVRSRRNAEFQSFIDLKDSLLRSLS